MKVRVRNTRIEDYPGILALCRAVYPNAKPWTEEQIRSHLRLFPEGQFVAEDVATGEILGMASSLVVYWDDYEFEDNWRDFTDGGFFTNHDPENGHTLYGAEVMVHPKSQGLGIGKMLYAAREGLVKKLGLARIRAGARLRGYGLVSGEMTAGEYVNRVLGGEIGDPTLSFQLKRGFKVLAVVDGYLPNDPESLGWAAVIEWRNPLVKNQPATGRTATSV